jgi:hypothetical protein
MREFKIGSKKATQFIHALIGGIPSSGKTHFASTFPKPLFLSDAAEGGYKTLEYMDRDYWWDPNHAPDVWAQENMMDLPIAVTRLQTMAKGGKFPFQSIIVDSVSIYAERLLAELKMANPGEDNRQRYGSLADALRAQVVRINALPANIIWLCHVTTEGELTLPGKAAATIPAYMDHKWLCVAVTEGKKATDYQLRTVPYKKATWLGNRVAVPDPSIPSFKYIAGCLGLPIKPVSPACPVFGGVDYRNGIEWG